MKRFALTVAALAIFAIGAEAACPRQSAFPVVKAVREHKPVRTAAVKVKESKPVRSAAVRLVSFPIRAVKHIRCR